MSLQKILIDRDAIGKICRIKWTIYNNNYFCIFIYNYKYYFIFDQSKSLHSSFPHQNYIFLDTKFANY